MNSRPIGFLVASASQLTRLRIEELLNAFPSPCNITRITNLSELQTASPDGVDVAIASDLCVTPEKLGLLRQSCPGVPVIRISADDSPGTREDSTESAELCLPADQLEEGPFFRVVGWALEHKSLLSGSDAADAEPEPVAEERDSLEDAMWHLSGRDRERIDLIVNTSHELRTPLTAMLYGLGNLLKGVAGPVEEKPRVYLEMLKAECERMLTTVEDLLNVQQADAGAVLLHTVPLFFGRLVDRRVAALEDEVADRELSVDVSTVPGFIACDPHRMQRAVSNVLKNAVRFSPFGGTIRVSLTKEDDGWFALSIEDEGEGIEPQYLDKVMEPYFQVDGQIEGTGLGLSIAKEVLQRSGGDVLVESPAPGQTCGTRVTLRVPAAPAPKALAVDDSRTVQMALKGQLTRAGYAVTLAGNGLEALDCIEQEVPDVLVVDSVMPDMNGEELVLEIKSRHDLRSLPIVMLTGAEIDRGKRSFLEGFGIPALGKPWHVSELLGCIDDVIIGKGYLTR